MNEYGLSGDWFGVTYEGDIWFDIPIERYHYFDVELDCFLEDLEVTTSFTQEDYFLTQRDWILKNLKNNN